MKYYVIMAKMSDDSEYPVAVTTNPDEVNAVRAKFGMFNTWIVEDVRGADDILKPMYYVRFSPGGAIEKVVNKSNVLRLYAMCGRKYYLSDGSVEIWAQAKDQDSAISIARSTREKFLAKIREAMEVE